MILSSILKALVPIRSVVKLMVTLHRDSQMIWEGITLHMMYSQGFLDWTHVEEIRKEQSFAMEGNESII